MNKFEQNTYHEEHFPDEYKYLVKDFIGMEEIGLTILDPWSNFKNHEHINITADMKNSDKFKKP